MEHFFNITEIIQNYGYVGIFIIVFLESGLIFFLPGDSLLFTAGILASGGFLTIHSLIPLIFISTFLGALMGYQIGVHLEKLHNYAFFRKLLQKEYIDKAHVFFEKYGKLTIIISRFVPVVRTFTPIVAGVVHMKYSSFLKFSFFGSLLWSVVVTLVGFLVGELIPQAKNYMSLLILIVVIASLIPAIYHAIKERNKKD